MMTISVVKFEPEHLVALELREHERNHIDKADMMVYITSMGAQTVTLLDDHGVVIGITGYWVVWENVLHVYVLPSIHVPKYPISFVRTIKRWLDMLFKGYRPHRMQTWSLDDKQTNKWMEILGFHCEGVLQKFTYDKIDYRMWARIQ